MICRDCGYLPLRRLIRLLSQLPAVMAYQNRPLNSTLRHPSIGGAQASTGQSPMLIARINEKKAELENLKELRDLSAGLASQMQTLEDKLSTLSDGAEGQWKLAPAHQGELMHSL